MVCVVRRRGWSMVSTTYHMMGFLFFCWTVQKQKARKDTATQHIHNLHEMSRVPVIAFPEDVSLPALRTPTHPVIRFVKIVSRITLLATLVIFLIAKYMISPSLAKILKGRFEFHNAAYRKLKALHSKLKTSVQNPPSINVTYKGKTLIDRTIASDDIIMEETKLFEAEKFKKNSKGKYYNAQFSYTNGKEVRFSDDLTAPKEQRTFTELNHEVSYSSTNLVNSLESFKDSLKALSVPEYKQPSTSGSGFDNGNPEMYSLLYQIKQFKTYLEVVTSEHPREMLFKKPLYHIQLGRNDNRNLKFNYLDTLHENINSIQQEIESI